MINPDIRRTYYNALCLEMEKLRTRLDEMGIAWTDHSDYDSEHSTFDICRTRFTYNGTDWSVIHGHGSYGGWHTFNPADPGLLEAYAIHEEGADPEGHLTADEVIHLILHHSEGDSHEENR